MPARTGDAKVAGVVGFPVSHSLSPALHEFWLKTYNIDGAYVPLAITPGDFSGCVKSLGAMGVVGLNVTLPHKEQAFSFSITQDDMASITKSVNTLVAKHDGSFHGRNTDVFGFMENLRQHEAPANRPYILGAGGAARGICAGLLKEGCQTLYLSNRTQSNAEALAADLKQYFDTPINVIPWDDRDEILSEVDLLVNTTQLGMKGQPPLEIDISALHKDAAVCDIVYNPLETPLLAAARQQKLKTVDGLGMLLYQAVPAFEAFYGVKPEVTPALRQHLTDIIEGTKR